MSAVPPTSETGEWVDADHLRDAAAAAHREELRRAPGVTVLDGFLRAEVFDRLAAFASLQASFTPQYALVPGRRVSREEWLSEPAERRLYALSSWRGLGEVDPDNPDTATFLRFREELRAGSLLRHLGGLAPTEDSTWLQAIDFIAYGPGQFLAPHTDVSVRADRVLCGVLYLTPDWTAELGGALRFHPPDLPPRTVDAIANRLVLFDPRTSGEHEVLERSAAAGERVRRACVFWLAVGLPRGRFGR